MSVMRTSQENLGKPEAGLARISKNMQLLGGHSRKLSNSNAQLHPQAKEIQSRYINTKVLKNQADLNASSQNAFNYFNQEVVLNKQTTHEKQ